MNNMKKKNNSCISNSGKFMTILICARLNVILKCKKKHLNIDDEKILLRREVDGVTCCSCYRNRIIRCALQIFFRDLLSGKCVIGLALGKVFVRSHWACRRLRTLDWIDSCAPFRYSARIYVVGGFTVRRVHKFVQVRIESMCQTNMDSRPMFTLRWSCDRRYASDM